MKNISCFLLLNQKYFLLYITESSENKKYIFFLLLNEVRIKLATSELPACIVLHSVLLSKLASSSSLPSSLVHNKKPTAAIHAS
jgi:hypothetical protein